jgi:acyl-CoA thioesterase FadM
MWGETDVAGSVDLSSLTRYSMEALESWFRDRLKVDWYQLHVQRRVATPFVRAELEFHGAVRPGEGLEVIVRVEKLGRSSVVFHVAGQAEVQARRCWEGRFTCVFANAETLRSMPVPEEYRPAFERAATGSAGASS